MKGNRRSWHPSRNVWPAVVLWAVLMAPLMWWGLPSSRNDDLLFGGQPKWDAQRYPAMAALNEREQRNAGADTDLDPIAARDRIIDLTATETDRGAILLRYRLYTRQPDEMITLMALQRMRPRDFDFDPRMIQYGGGYVYLVGAALGAASQIGLVHLTRDVGVYLDEPEQFARFYLVGRFISLLFGALLLSAVARLAALAAGRTAGWIALVLVAASPVFISDVLEMKPHLPSACMILWAILAALRLAARWRTRDAVWLGLQSGYAVGLVLTGAAAAAMWPVLAWTHTRLPWRILLMAGGLAVGSYAITNPYVMYNSMANRGALTSNLGNSTAMYNVGHFGEGAMRVAELLVEGVGAGLLVAGTLGAIVLARRYRRESLIAASPGLAMVLLCIAIGAGKPAEFGRFLLLPSVLLAIAAAVGIAMLASWRTWSAVLVLVVIMLVMPTRAYIVAFAADAHGVDESRRAAAAYLRDHAAPDDAIAVVQAPAPYAIPPLDFTRRRVLLLPPSTPTYTVEADLPTWLVLTADDASTPLAAWWRRYYRAVAEFPGGSAGYARITWANKPVFVFRRITD